MTITHDQVLSIRGSAWGNLADVWIELASFTSVSRDALSTNDQRREDARLLMKLIYLKHEHCDECELYLCLDHRTRYFSMPDPGEPETTISGRLHLDCIRAWKSRVTGEMSLNMRHNALRSVIASNAALAARRGY